MKGTGVMVPDQITRIQLVTAMGYYAPLTPSGDIVIDDIIVSSYAVVSNRHLAHKAMSVYRWWIQMQGPAATGGDDEQGNIHWIMQIMQKVARRSFIGTLVSNEFFDGTVHLSVLP